MFRSSLSSTELKQYSVPSACTAKFLRNRFCRYFTVRRHSVREYFYCICFLDSSPQKTRTFLLVINLTLADLSVGFTGKLMVLGIIYWTKQSHLPRNFRDLSFRVCNRILVFFAFIWPLSSKKHQGLLLQRDYGFVSRN